jgi:hypothetical protein
MTGIYGVAERAELTALAERIAAGYPHPAAAAAAIADRLRLLLPDLDDVTIGRVLLALTNNMSPIWLVSAVSPGDLWAGLAFAGLRMTETEWKNSETISPDGGQNPGG